MQRSSLNRIVFFSVLVLSLFIVSCSSKVIQLQHVQPDSYLSPKYEDESFKNVSMDICYPILDYDIPPEGADTAHIMNMKEFDTSFKKYFPEGIKMFSSFTNTGWVFFKPNYNLETDIIEYQTKTSDGSDFYVYLVDSIAFFQRQSNSDFLMMFQMISINKNPADSTNPKSKNATIIDLQYSIWDKITGDLVVMDKVSAKMEFDRLAGYWPYRSPVMKTAALIFEKLPMFEK